jgi:hypothetical protein
VLAWGYDLAVPVVYGAEGSQVAPDFD